MKPEIIFQAWACNLRLVACSAGAEFHLLSNAPRSLVSAPGEPDHAGAKRSARTGSKHASFRRSNDAAVSLGRQWLLHLRGRRILAAALGIVGLMLAVVGVYGVVSFAASQRTHEIGIGLALGASRPDILLLVLRQGLVLVITGVVSGVLLAGGLSHLMATLW